MNKSLIIVLILINCSTSVLTKSNYYYNKIETKTNLTELSDKYCIKEYISDQNQTQNQKRDNYYSVKSLLNENFCKDIVRNFNTNLKDKVVLINYNKDCDIERQINVFNDTLIVGLIISIGCVTDEVEEFGLFDNKFILSFISGTSVDQILTTNVDRIQFSSINFNNDFIDIYSTIIVIWFLATFTVILGSYWSGSVRLKIFQLTHIQTDHTNKGNDRKVEINTISERIDRSTNDGKHVTLMKTLKIVTEEPLMHITPVRVICFVILMVVMLLSAYFFFQYMVYVIIGLFSLASAESIFLCGEPILLRLLPTRFTQLSFTVFSKSCGKLYFYQLLLLIIGFSVSITWIVIRNESYSWYLQDVLNVCLCLSVLSIITVRSYQICVILLYLLFFYDIFFVFITPLFTSNGKSVMESAATGGSSKSRCDDPGEQIPVLLRVPHLSFKTDPLDVCFANQYSMLGLGDIVIPGLLVSYCYAFDLIFDIKPRIYFITTSIGYGLGLIAAFLGLYLMDGSAQPALLYLVPFVTIPPTLIALWRKEFKRLWIGPEVYLTANKSQKVEENAVEDVNRNDDRLIDESQPSVPTNSI